MDNNDVFRRVRYIFDYRDAKMVEIFALADHQVTPSQVTKWLKKDGQYGYKEISDKELAIFLNGLITEHRGKKDGPQPKPEERLNNNLILRKLRIAFNLRSEDILDVLALRGVNISKHELSAFFRKHTQSQYRLCEDQYLREFLNGLQLRYRDGAK